MKKGDLKALTRPIPTMSASRKKMVVEMFQHSAHHLQGIQGTVHTENSIYRYKACTSI